MLNPELGEVVSLAGEDHVKTKVGPGGFVIYGPYAVLAPGRYSVEFAVASDGSPDDDQSAICARLDVAANHGRTLYSRRDINRSELSGSLTSFSLAFDVAKNAKFEFRVWTSGVAPLLIRMERPVRERGDDGSPAARWFPNTERRPVPMVLADYEDDLQVLHARGADVRFVRDDLLEIRVGNRTCQICSYDELVACCDTFWPDVEGAQYRGMPSYWEKRALAAHDRQQRLASFGQKALGVVAQTRHGLFVVDPEDGGVAAALLNTGTCGDGELDWATSLMSADGDVLIVGTHIGALLVPMSRACRTLTGVEANPRTFELLQMNVALNRCENVTLHNVAAGEKADRIQFLISRENSGGSKIMPVSREEYYVYDNPEIVEIEAVPLDEALGDRSYDLILMDIEGSEYLALKGMPRLLRRAGALVVEFIPHHLRQVVNVTIEQFTACITPYFDLLLVPSRESVFSADQIVPELQRMYAAGENHDGLYFLKRSALERMDQSMRQRLRAG